MRVLASLGWSILFCLSACSTFRQVDSTSKLVPEERLIIAEIEYVNKSIREILPGAMPQQSGIFLSYQDSSTEDRKLDKLKNSGTS